MHVIFFIHTSFDRPRCHPRYCWQPFTGQLLFTKSPRGQRWEREKQGEIDRSGEDCPARDDHYILRTRQPCARQAEPFWFYREKWENDYVQATYLYSLWSFFTLCTNNNRTDAAFPSVSTSHARISAKDVKHCLDELWEIVIVLPAPVLPCIGVVKVHWPTVSWK